jgi:hypothetical protein
MIKQYCQFIWFHTAGNRWMKKHGALIEWNWLTKTKILTELLICQPQISQGLAWDQNLFSVVTGRSVTALAKGKTFLNVTSCGLVGLLMEHIAFIFILSIQPTWCTIFLSMFISLLYMFRATICPSSGETIVFMQHLVDCIWNVMAHVQKPDFIFWGNGRVHLNRQGR